MLHITAASVIGSAHVNPGQPSKGNNQDALAVRELPKGQVVVLCDGCGTQPRSEIGADIGANIIASVVQKQLLIGGTVNWKMVNSAVTKALRQEVQKFVSDDSVVSFERAVVERFLFTAMVLTVVNDDATVASFGDGFIMVDDEIININPPIKNAPPYIGYRLLGKSDYHTKELKDHLQFVVQKEVKISKLSKGLVVATDGLNYLDPEDFHHPALVQGNNLLRWLSLQATEKVVDGKLKVGKCRDDITVIIVRSEEAQAELFASRKKISELKSLTSAFREKLHAFLSRLDRSEPIKSVAEKELEDFKSEFFSIRVKCEKLNQLPNTLQELEVDMKLLEKRVSEIKPPVVYTKYYYRSYLDTLGDIDGLEKEPLPVAATLKEASLLQPVKIPVQKTPTRPYRFSFSKVIPVLGGKGKGGK